MMRPGADNGDGLHDGRWWLVPLIAYTSLAVILTIALRIWFGF